MSPRRGVGFYTPPWKETAVKLTRLGIVAATVAATPGVALAQGGEQPVPAKITAFSASKSVTFGERV